MFFRRKTRQALQSQKPAENGSENQTSETGHNALKVQGMKIAFTASAKPQAQETMAKFVKRYGQHKIEDADVIVPVGGDGMMLDTLKDHLMTGLPIYGIDRGTVGFLMNKMSLDNLPERIAAAEAAIISPLEMIAYPCKGEPQKAIAFNEISLLRQTRQTARIQIAVNGRTRMDMLICDGVLLATPIGSTAYNLSAHGTILPIGAKMLALTPISAFRPRRWKGALLPEDSNVTFTILDPDYRPVAAVADNVEVRDVVKVEAHLYKKHTVTMLYDPDHSLEERIVREQFEH